MSQKGEIQTLKIKNIKKKKQRDKNPWDFHGKHGKHRQKYKKSFEFMFTFTGKTMRGDPWQSLSTHIAEGGTSVRAGVPVMHPREVFHVKLAGLGSVQSCQHHGTINT